MNVNLFTVHHVCGWICGTQGIWNPECGILNLLNTHLWEHSKFECFKQVSCQELSDLLAKSSIKSCALDPISATVLKGCLDLLLPFITKLVNCSLQCSVMTESMKQAQLRPFFKKPSLNHELFKNYRPISNLMFISKSCEKAVAVQLKDHVRNNNLDELFIGV